MQGLKLKDNYKNQVNSLTFSNVVNLYDDKSQIRKIDELRQRLRMRGLRCNLVYTHAGLRLNVIPLFASRKQALRSGT